MGCPVGYKMASLGIKDGDDIKEVLDFIDQLYELQMPMSILKRLLRKIELEVNKDEEKPKNFLL